MPELNAHILVPTDLSTKTWNIWQFALQRGLELRARLTFLHVAPCVPVWRKKSGLDALEYLHDALHLPTQAAASIPTHARTSDWAARIIAERVYHGIHPEMRDFLHLQTVIRKGNVTEQILAFARDEEVDTIVLSARPRKSRWRWLPTVAEQVMRRAACRVVVVRHPDCEDGSTRLRSPLVGA